MLEITTTSDVTLIFGDPDVALVSAIEVRPDGSERKYLVVDTGDSASQLADYARLGDSLKFNAAEESMPQIDEEVLRSIREYRWDWNITPDTALLFVTSLDDNLDLDAIVVFPNKKPQEKPEEWLELTTTSEVTLYCGYPSVAIVEATLIHGKYLVAAIGNSARELVDSSYINCQIKVRSYTPHDHDMERISQLVKGYCATFGLDFDKVILMISTVESTN